MSDLHPPDLSEDGVSELELARHLTMDSDPPAPRSGAELLRMADRADRGTPPWRFAALAAVLALAIVGSYALLSGEPPERLAMRGLDDVAPEVELRWVLDGADPSRGGDAPVAPDQQVVFAARSSAAGFLCVEEQRPDSAWHRILPPDGATWTVEPGDSLPTRDGKVLAFRTDDGPGHRLYRLLLDPDHADCKAPVAIDEVEIDWLP